jgi:hypothetical protein
MKDVKEMKEMKGKNLAGVDPNARRSRAACGGQSDRRETLLAFMSFKTFMTFLLTFPPFVLTSAIGLR